MSTQVEAQKTGTGVAAVEMTYREAIRAALDDEMAADSSVLLLGEDIADAGGPFKTSEGLYEKYGGERVINTPIAENGFTGVALGMALAGLRPVVEIMFSDFLLTAADAITVELPKWRFMSGGQCTTPVTIRASGGAGGRFGAQHSSTCESWFLQVAGLRIAASATPASAYGLLRAAIRSDDPVLLFEHKAMYGLKGPVVRTSHNLPKIGRGEVVRPGSDVTIVGTMLMLQRALAAAEAVAADGIEAEVIDPRWIRPLDVGIVRASLEKTGRLIVVEEQYHPGGWGASLISQLTLDGYGWPIKPVALSMPALPIPYSPQLEDAMLPSVEAISTEIGRLVEG